MRFAAAVFLSAALVAPAIASAASKPPPAPTAPAFGLSGVVRTKVGDSSQDNALYAGGQHAMRRYGNELVVVYPEPASGRDVTVRLARSRDGGLSWEPARVVFQGAGISDIGTPMAVGPDPAGGGKYRVHVGFYQAQGFYYTWATVDPAAGARGVGPFGPPVLVSGAVQLNGYYGVAADSAGGVHIAYDGVVNGADLGVYYSRSADHGASFVETATFVAPGGGWPVLAADAAGDVYLAYLGQTSGTYVARRAAGAAGFAPGVLVTTKGGGEVSLACSADGTRVYLAWTWESGPSQVTYHVARSADSGATWKYFDGPQLGQSAFGPSIEVSAAGKVGLAFTDYGTDELRFVLSTDAGATWSPPAVVPSAPWGATVVFDAQEKANVAWVDDVYGASAVYFTKQK